MVRSAKKGARRKGENISVEPWHEDDREINSLIRNHKYKSRADAARAMIELGLQTYRQQESGLAARSLPEQVAIILRNVEQIREALLGLGEGQAESLHATDALFQLGQDIFAESYGAASLLLRSLQPELDATKARSEWEQQAAAVAKRIIEPEQYAEESIPGMAREAEDTEDEERARQLFDPVRT